MEIIDCSIHTTDEDSVPIFRLISRLLALCALTGFLIGSLFQGSLAQAQDRRTLSVYAGAVIYDDPSLDTLVLIEFPFILERSQFEFFRPDSTDSNWYGRVFAQVRLLNTDGKAFDSSQSYFSIRADSPDEARSNELKVFHSLGLLVSPGMFSARLTVIDVVSKNEANVFYDKIIITLPPKDRLHIGAVCMAYEIRYVGESELTSHDRLVKNGLKILVNPYRIFTQQDSALSFYAELYNLDYSPRGESRHQLNFVFLDDTGEVVRDYGLNTRLNPGSSAIVVEVFDISGWPAGKYTIRLIATDLAVHISDTVSLGFQITGAMTTAFYNKSMFSEVDAYDTLSFQTKLNLVKYMLTPPERISLYSLSDSGKIRYLEQFWQDHDETPSTRENETRLEYISRYTYANERFSTNATRSDGWRTDRGRIYITQGYADRIKEVDVPALTNPFHVWFYFGIDEGVIYVFEDDRNAFQFRLVHSNADGEVFNQAWNQTIKDQELLEDF